MNRKQLFYTNSVSIDTMLEDELEFENADDSTAIQGLNYQNSERDFAYDSATNNTYIFFGDNCTINVHINNNGTYQNLDTQKKYHFLSKIKLLLINCIIFTITTFLQV